MAHDGFGADSAVEPVALIEVLPPLHESGKDGQLDRFDLLTQCGERAPPTNFDDAARAPFDVVNLPTELAPNELPCSLPLNQSQLDPFPFPTVARMNFERGNRPGLREKARQNFASRDRGVYSRGSQNLWDDVRRLLLS